MKIAKDGIRSIVRVGYDGRIYKTFRGTDADKRFAQEVKVLETLERRGCSYVPRVLDTDPDELTLVTTNCGKPVENMSDTKLKSIFEELKRDFGVIHDDPFVRNITYDAHRGRFCVIDFELAEILARDEVDEFLKLTWGGISRGGKFKHGRNDDSLACFGSTNGWAEEHSLSGSDTIMDDGIVFALSDGMGGPGGGDIASALTVNELRRFLPGVMGGFKGAGNWLEVLEGAMEELHHFVTRIAHSREGLSQMGATLVTGLFFRRTMYFGHVGDSRMYLFRDGKLKQLTLDQTLVGRYLRDGLISERKARNHPRRNILMQAIAGGCENIAPQMGQEELLAGDWFLICSDGLIDGLWDHRIEHFFAKATANNENPQDVAEEMLTYACNAAGRDDTTLFVIHAELAE